MAATTVKVIPYHIQLNHAFGVAGHTRTSTPIVLLELTYKGVTGYGEASLPPYLGVTQANVITYLNTVNFDFVATNTIDVVNSYLNNLPNTLAPAICAVDIAWHDLHCKLNNTSVANYYGIDTSTMPCTTFTIGIDTPETIANKVSESNEFKLLKIKVGSSNDVALLTALKKATHKPFMVDANQGWQTLEQAIELSTWLQQNHCYCIEQPFNKHDVENTQALKAMQLLPLFADEAFQTINDLDKIAHSFDGVNIKLMKCGGIYPAVQIIKAARALNLKIMLGSMNESSCAILAAAHLAPLCDYCDLDGPWLINNNPFNNPLLIEGKIIIENKIGLGLTPSANYPQ
jgi:L-Ala-D/L-Glu epimerase